MTKAEAKKLEAQALEDNNGKKATLKSELKIIFLPLGLKALEHIWVFT